MAILEASQVVLEATGGGFEASRSNPGAQHPTAGEDFRSLMNSLKGNMDIYGKSESVEVRRRTAKAESSGTS